jgi:hypothetical protein
MPSLRCESRLVRLTAVASAVVAVGAFVAFHFTMVVLYNARPNPIKLRHSRLIGGYIDPLFTQDWHLFSPNPINFDIILLVRARLRAAEGGVVETRWIDITTPLLDKLHRRRLSSLGSLAHIQTYTLLARSPSPAYREFEQLLCRGDSPVAACDEDSPALDVQRQMAERLMVRVASAHARRLFPADEIVAVQVRTVLSRFPRFSQRQRRDASPALSVVDSPWLPYEVVDLFR